MADRQPPPQPTSESLEREFKRLRGAVSEYPALRPIVDRLPKEAPDPSTRDTEQSTGPTDGLEAAQGHTTAPPRAEAMAMAGGGTEVQYPVSLAIQDYDQSTHLAPRPMRLEDKQDALQARQDIYMNRVRKLNKDLKRGNIEADEWLRRMMGQVKDLHTTAYAIGYSGRWDEIGRRDWLAVANATRRQYRYLRAWRQEILRDGMEAFSLAQLNDRAQKYGAAARESFEKGYSAEVGMPPEILPAYPGDGTTECMTRCKCRWAINILDKQNQDFDCTWTLGVAEHCETCMERASEWVQLEIRNGVLTDTPEPIFARS